MQKSTNSQFDIQSNGDVNRLLGMPRKERLSETNTMHPPKADIKDGKNEMRGFLDSENGNEV